MFSHQAPQEDQGTESRSSGARGRDEGDETREGAGGARLHVQGGGRAEEAGGPRSGSAWARIAWSSTSRRSERGERKPWRSGSSSTWPSRPSLRTSSQGLDVGGELQKAGVLEPLEREAKAKEETVETLRSRVDNFDELILQLNSPETSDTCNVSVETYRTDTNTATKKKKRVIA
ncbi:hypothetical protein MUK42_09009 [Musa troglodytarum]|uniref:Uncharacterized protein n=1 Tax=Musa troglodytarum TaxID=320322 RepID=A0A9E7FV61_9LILI|nr:hypothetical protein MUK42_09009 [Musa troglodytarum]